MKTKKTDTTLVANYTKAPIILPPLKGTQFGQVTLLPGANQVSSDYLLTLSEYREGRTWPHIMEMAELGLISDPLDTNVRAVVLDPGSLAQAKANIAKEKNVKTLRMWRDQNLSKALTAQIEKRLGELSIEAHESRENEGE